MRQKIVAGNWKMNTDHFEAMKLASEIAGMVNDELPTTKVKIIIAPPAVHLYPVARLLKDNTLIALASQNCSSESSGAYTGEISAGMIKSAGASYAIIGHSERRTYFGEVSGVLKKKIDLALQSGIIPIFCCGETGQQRNSGDQFNIVGSQLSEALFHLPNNEFKKIIIAYEPVWAIGTGVNATPQQAQEMHAFIRQKILDKYGALANEITVLYGGSCNAANAKQIFSNPDVDGGLIGGSSLKAREFVDIIKALQG